MKIKIHILAIAISAAISGMTNAGNIRFTTVAVPINDLDKRSVLTSNFAVVDGEKVDISYHTLLRTGDRPKGSWAPFGLIRDKEGLPVILEDGSFKISNDNDFSSLIRGDNGVLYMVSHFESLPAAMYLTQLYQKKNGELFAKRTRPLNFAKYNGGWVHCAGSVSPWGTHLGSEEYPPNSKQWVEDNTVSSYNASMVRYFPQARFADDVDLPALAKDLMNPYDYGYVVEVHVKDFRNADVTKHYSMGRVAIELSYVMPNQKTVYISDDGSSVGLFRYEADTAGDLSSGELFVAKWKQISPWTHDNERLYSLNGGAGDISWISLGHATDTEIRRIIRKGVTFSDIFSEDVDGCTKINNRDATLGHAECLKVKPGMEKAAAFLETSRYAALVGGSVEFEKMEGITLDPDNNTMYLSMSRVRKAMSDNKGDISVPYNYCGTVYALDLNEDYVAEKMYGIVNGIPRLFNHGAIEDNPYPEDGPYASNQCDLNAISEPDNITFMPGYKTLIIAEDTGHHQNDMIWSYNLDAKELTRIQTTPFGSEATSAYFYPNIGGYAYLMSVIQHPFGESDRDQLLDDEARGYSGYIGPFPAMDQ